MEEEEVKADLVVATTMERIPGNQGIQDTPEAEVVVATEIITIETSFKTTYQVFH